MDALTIMALRFSLAALVLLPIPFLAPNRLSGERPADRLLEPDARPAGLLLYLYPVFVAILAALFLHEPITRRKAFTLALVGLALTVGPAGGE
jgi:drug/metabolite transporter (DMT)-like permease